MTADRAIAAAPADIPWIVSVDDHVIEPASLWVSRLPARYPRRRAPGRATAGR